MAVDSCRKDNTMARIPIIGAAAVLVLHSLVHLMGTAVYMRLTTIQCFAYKTTLLGGRWDLGTSGTWGFGLLWLLAGAGRAGGPAGPPRPGGSGRPALAA